MDAAAQPEQTPVPNATTMNNKRDGRKSANRGREERARKTVTVKKMAKKMIWLSHSFTNDLKFVSKRGDKGKDERGRRAKLKGV